MEKSTYQINQRLGRTYRIEAYNRFTLNTFSMRREDQIVHLEKSTADDREENRRVEATYAALVCCRIESDGERSENWHIDTDECLL